MKISKELLSEIMNGVIVKDVHIVHNKVYLTKVYQEFIEDVQNEEIENVTLNIYELAHKCKEWAFRFGYEMCSYKLQDTENPNCRCLFAHNSLNLNKDKRVGFYADTEPEAIFKACEWVLEQKAKS